MAYGSNPPRDQMLERPLPHSPEAERAILGGILLNNTLISQAIEKLRPDDFYVPSHRRIYLAMVSLFEQGSAIDPLLVAEELRRDAALDTVGGVAFVTNLTYGLPHFANIQEYSKLVGGKAMMRNLVKAANLIISEALEEADPPEEIVDHAEQYIFNIADQRNRTGFTHIQGVANNVLESVQKMSGRNVMLTGLTTGFTELDQMTSGLQPTDLIIIAARPSMGKTALCLSIAQNAALQAEALVAIFSLEMSKEALVMRMLSSEARVDAHRFRSGFLSKEEWARLAHALGTLSEARIFIDDTAAISVLEMRAKLRRLATEQKKLDLVIVDYLQLMSGNTGRRPESRQQEVSSISRDLKGIAKEFGVPVIALSQLSRAPETRTDHRPQLSDLRESGCLAGESLVTMADTGERVPIRDLVGKSGFAVWALNEKTWKLERAIVTNAFATGVKPIYRLTTRLGRAIRATGNHKFYTFNGWKRLDEIQLNERLAVPRALPSPDTQTMSDAELALLGHLIGDGCTLPSHAVQYTTRELDLAEIVAGLARDVFGDDVKPRINPERNWYQVYLASTRRHTHGVHSAVAEWLRKLSAWGLRSYEKRIPEKVFAQPAKAIGLFLRHLWATDGCIRFKPTAANRRYPSVFYASSSKQLAVGVQSLLLRLGINARLGVIPQKDKGRDQYSVTVSGKPDLESFIELIGAVGLYKNTSLLEIKEHLAQSSANSNRDSIPSDIWRRYVVPAMQENGITTRQMSAAIDTAYCGTSIYKQNVSRERAARIAEAVKSEPLHNLAHSAVYWDAITSICPDGEAEVYDLTVAEHHNFTVNSIYCHNSLEQDSDVVGFIYREEQYNRTDENIGKAEFIIAKQRNGPTGVVNMVFMKEFTRFENIWQEGRD